jgi:hypothetical protein
MDDLIVRLRKSGVGCHIGGVFCGVVGYADDLLLMAPSRSAIEKMLTLCDDYTGENNLEFSTDPNPAMSKSKCIFVLFAADFQISDEKKEQAGAGLCLAQFKLG